VLAHTKVCNLEDFADRDFVHWAHRVLPHERDRFGTEWPTSHPYRKDWEVALAARALSEAGALHRGAEVIGIGAGNEPTLFWLTTKVRRVFATDLYLEVGWTESSSAEMLVDPGRSWPGAWDAQRLVVQHMDGRELKHPTGAFDAAFSSSSFEHFGELSDVRRAVEEVCRVVRPGGLISISTELRLAGEPPGIPGSLLFSRSELLQTFVEGLPVEPLGKVDLSVSAATEATVWPFQRFAADVETHLAANEGALRFHALTWSRYPAIVLEHDGRRWTSVHLALRRLRGRSALCRSHRPQAAR
jgi:SAM-dependent methyltransferase